jgi:triosephosphate isomerase
MLAEAGATVVIVGHSERRRAYGETDATVAHKALAALHGGLTPIICVGETQAERDAGQALAVVCRQVAESTPRDLAEHPFILAYEPIWAIGSGHPPKPEQIEQMHHAIRGAVIDAVGDSGAGVPILYGGSVDPDNAGGILAVSEVGGALVGGASLKAEDFLEILRAAG